MFAIRFNGLVLSGRFDSWDEAVEAAQEDYALPLEAFWSVVRIDKSGNAG